MQHASAGGFDGARTSMTAQASAGGALPVITAGMFAGLWFGGNQGSATYSFGFSAPVGHFGSRINAMSTLGAHVETFGSFVLDTAATPILACTSYSNSAWDGPTAAAGPADNGDFRLAVSVGPGQSFRSVSFYHSQSGTPNGPVVHDHNHQLAIPQPDTCALMLCGLGLLGTPLRSHPFGRVRKVGETAPAGTNWPWELAAPCSCDTATPSFKGDSMTLGGGLANARGLRLLVSSALPGSK